jgi:hypothetical protein
MRARYTSLLAAGLLGGAVLFASVCIVWFGSHRKSIGPDEEATTMRETIVRPRGNSAASGGIGAQRPPEFESARFGGWRELYSQQPSAERDGALVALLEELAAADPTRALSLVETEPDSARRNELFQAVLRGWGGADPEAAIAWAGDQAFLDHGLASAAVFHGMAPDPEKAVRLTARWSAQTPERAADFSAYLVAAFGRAGKFDRAVSFAADAPADLQTPLVNAAFASWGERDPPAAVEAAALVADPALKHLAGTAVIGRWAERDGKAVVEFAQKLPDGAEKTFALATGLRAWAMNDLVEAATWLSRVDASPELDRAAAVVASLPRSLQQPQFAASVAENITDAKLRVRVLSSVVNEWAAVDPIAARAYAENSPNIRSEERSGVLAAFEPDFNAASFAP